ncbi:MAG: DUF1570 domain-containing protein [bacterium]|nr:DUF1570 domain-containing protein [bacterium]
MSFQARGYRRSPHLGGGSAVSSVNGRCRLGVCCLLAGMLTGHAAAAERPEPEAHAELRALIGPGAQVIRTQRFVVAYDTSVEIVQRLTARVEATYLSIQKYCEFNGIEFRPPGHRLEILLFDQPANFYRHAKTLGVDAEGYSGLYFIQSDRSSFYNVLNHPVLAQVQTELEKLEAQVRSFSGRKLNRQEKARKREVLQQLQTLRNRRDRLVEKLNRTVVQHEVAHHVLFDCGIHVKGAPAPDWLVEGLACVFETPPSAKGSGMGVTNQMRLADFRAACGEVLDAANPRQQNLKAADVSIAFRSGRFVPLRRFLTQQELSDQADNSNISFRYAQAWSLVFYLQRTHREELAAYMSLLARRQPGQPVTAEEELTQFEAVFGQVDERFERRWAGFILKLRFLPQHLQG